VDLMFLKLLNTEWLEVWMMLDASPLRCTEGKYFSMSRRGVLLSTGKDREEIRLSQPKWALVPLCTSLDFSSTLSNCK